MGIGPTFQRTTCIFVLPISGTSRVFGTPAPIRRISSIVSAIIWKCGWTAWPSGESRTGGPRSNNAPPSSCSSRRIAVESDGCETPQMAAARVNPRASQIARKYLICGRSTVQSAQARHQGKQFELRKRPLLRSLPAMKTRTGIARRSAPQRYPDPDPRNAAVNSVTLPAAPNRDSW
jgi:hypothetical protein